MRQRDNALDILRILACLMVVMMHSPLPSANANGPFLAALSYATAPCIGLFFMVSGALLLPVKTDYFSFLRRRFGKVAVPTLVWSLVYIALRLYYSESEINVLQSVASIPFSAQGEGVLWFMYTLCGLYLLAPILSAWFEKASKRELQLVLMLWAVTLCYPLLDFYFITNTSTTGILYYFSGYAGYFLLGACLRRYPHFVSGRVCGGIALLGVVVFLALKHFGIAFNFYSLFWYESIFIAAFGVAIWKAVKCRNCISPATQKILFTVSNLSFGIYLIHIMVMRYWLWNQEWILSISNYPLQCLTIALITILLSTALCLIISLIPGSQWIIGLHYSRRN